MQVSLLVPYFNKASSLELLFEQLRELKQSLSRIYDSVEIVVVDDGSQPEQSQKLAQKVRASPEIEVKLIHHPSNQGKGAALVTAAKISTGDVLIWLDADAAFETQDIIEIATKARLQSHTLWVADRSRSQNEGQGAMRALASRAFRFLARSILRVPAKDIQAGLKAVPGPWFRGRVWRNKRFALDVELLREARRDGVLIAGVPVSKVRYEGQSSVQLSRASIQLFRELLGPLGRGAFLFGALLILLTNLRAFSLTDGVTWDARDEMFFYFRWLGSALRAGHFGDFIPNIASGYPIGANPQSGTYNPLYLLFAWLFPDSVLSINLLYVVLQLMMYAASFLLVYELGLSAIAATVSGLALVGSGFFTSHASHFSYLSSAVAWTGALLGLALASRQHFRLGAIVVALSIAHLGTSGYPAIWVFGAQVFTAAFVAFVLLSKQRSRFVLWIAGGCVAGAVLMSPSILHFIGQLKLSDRSQGLSVNQVLAGSLPKRAWLNLLVPYLDLRHEPDSISSTMSRFHALGLTVPFALLGLWWIRKTSRKTRFVFTLTFVAFAICTILSFGDHSGIPLRRWLADHFFIYRTGRFPSGEHSFFATLFLVCLAAFGIDRFAKRYLSSVARIRIFFLVVAVDFCLVMFGNEFLRYQRLAPDMRGTLSRFDVVFGPGDEAILNRERGCPFDPKREVDQRLTPPDRFSWSGYTNLIAKQYLNEREEYRFVICGPSRLWSLSETIKPWSFSLVEYSPGRVAFSTTVPPSKRLLWADVDDGRWSYRINGRPVDPSIGPARLRQLELGNQKVGDRVEVEMIYKGPLSRLWR